MVAHWAAVLVEPWDVWWVVPKVGNSVEYWDDERAASTVEC